MVTTLDLAGDADASEMSVTEREQADIDQALDHIGQQQKDLMTTREIYEKTAEETFGAHSGGLRGLDTGPVDTERDRKSVHWWGMLPDDGLTPSSYMLATDLYTHLDDLAGSLTRMIEAVNALSIVPGSQKDGNNGMSGGADGSVKIL